MDRLLFICLPAWLGQMTLPCHMSPWFFSTCLAQLVIYVLHGLGFAGSDDFAPLLGFFSKKVYQ